MRNLKRSLGELAGVGSEENRRRLWFTNKSESKDCTTIAASSSRSPARAKLSYINHNTDTGYIFVEHGIGLFGHSEGNDKTSGYSHSCHRCYLL